MISEQVTSDNTFFTPEISVLKAPRRSQNASGGLNLAQVGIMLAQVGPMLAQVGLMLPQDAPKIAQEASKRSPRSSELPPRCSQEASKGPRRSKTPPRCLQVVPICPETPQECHTIERFEKSVSFFFPFHFSVFFPISHFLWRGKDGPSQ